MNTTKRYYEALFIVDAKLSDEEVMAIIEKYNTIITEQGGEVLASDKWDRRKLAYEIKGHKDGIYAQINFAGESSVPAELGRVMKISDDVIRHIIIKIDPKLVDMTQIIKPSAEPAIDRYGRSSEKNSSKKQDSAESKSEEVPAADETPVVEADTDEVVEETTSEESSVETTSGE
ncbi:MAG: 30S ribosomal protein S6 [Armatimonadota bacterium]